MTETLDEVLRRIGELHAAEAGGLLQLTLSTVPADQRRSEAERLERIKRRVEVHRKLSTVVQWRVIEP